MKNQIVLLEDKCWGNEQYFRLECLEISGITFDAEAGELKETALKTFGKLLDVDPTNMEDCHWLKTINSSKKVIIKLSKRKEIINFTRIIQWYMLRSLEFVCERTLIFWRGLWSLDSGLSSGYSWLFCMFFLDFWNILSLEDLLWLLIYSIT